MSEPLFASSCSARSARRSPAAVGAPLRWAVAAGVLVGLAILDARERADPAAAARARGLGRRPRWSVARSRRRSCSSLVAVLAVAPWTIRNERTLHHFVPVSTQLGSALAGTYNSEARTDRCEPGVVAVAAPRRRLRGHLHPHARDERGRAREAAAPPRRSDYVARRTRATSLRSPYWTTLRVLDLDGMDWAIHTAADGEHRRAAGRSAGVICFWLFALLAVVGAFTRRGAARRRCGCGRSRLLMYLSVVFLVVETPRYRTRDRPVHRDARRARARRRRAPPAAPVAVARAARVLTTRELNRAVLARQGLLDRFAASLPRGLERVGGIQAQYAPSMYVGLWSRMPGLERAR